MLLLKLSLDAVYSFFDAIVSALLLRWKGAIDAMRRQIKEGGNHKQDDGGGLLRSLVSKHDSGAGGANNRTAFSDAEIVTQVKG